MTKVDTDFPRGNDVKIGEDANQSKRKKFASDNLFRVHETHREDESDSKSKKKQKSASDQLVEEKVSIELFNQSILSIGQIIIGCVVSVGEFSIKLVLPSAGIVEVPIYNISNAYTNAIERLADEEENVSPPTLYSMFEIGQCFPVRIISKPSDDSNRKNKTELFVIGSLNPRDLHENILPTNYKEFHRHIPITAAVASVEDHGYLMDIGFGEHLQGFLSREEAKPFISTSNVLKRTELPVGYLVRCIGTSISGRVVQLSTKEKLLNKRVSGDEEYGILSISTVLPGIRMSLRVMDLNDKGLQVVAANEHSGFVGKNHLRSEWELPQENYTVGDLVDGTVLYTTFATKRLALTLRPLPTPQSVAKKWSGLKRSQLITDAVICGKDNSNTVILRWKKKKFVANKGEIFDNTSINIDQNTIEETFPNGSKTNARIKCINYIDEVALVSLKESHIDPKSVCIDNIQVGQIVSGKVVCFIENRLKLQLGYCLDGYSNELNLADTPVVSKERLYPRDMTVRCRILNIEYTTDPATPNITVTCKKSMMDKKSFVLDTYEKVTSGTEAIGTIVLINDAGCLVTFFGPVKGWLPTRFITAYKENHRDFNIRLGQTVKCFVHSLVPPERLTLSLQCKAKKLS